MRKGIDLGYKKILDWIVSEGYEVNLKKHQLRLESYLPTNIPDCLYDKASIGRQSNLHLQLKLLMYYYLDNRYVKTPKLEQRIYLPLEERIAFEWSYGNFAPKELRSAHLVKEQYDAPLNNFGRTIEVDVWCHPCNAEVGFTSAENLIEPLICGVTRTAIYVPFPSGVDINHQLDPNQDIVAYEFQVKNAYKRNWNF